MILQILTPCFFINSVYLYFYFQYFSTFKMDKNYFWYLSTVNIRYFKTFTQVIFLIGDFRFYWSNFPVKHLYFYSSMGTLNTTAVEWRPRFWIGSETNTLPEAHWGSSLPVPQEKEHSGLLPTYNKLGAFLSYDSISCWQSTTSEVLQYPVALQCPDMKDYFQNIVQKNSLGRCGALPYSELI